VDFPNTIAIFGFSNALKVNILASKCPAPAAETLESRIVDIRFTVGGDAPTCQPRIIAPLMEMEDLYRRVPADSADYMITIPPQCLPKNDILLLLQETGLFEHINECFKMVALCSCIQLLNGAGIWKNAGGFVYYSGTAANAADLDPSSVYINFHNPYRIGNVLSVAEFFKLLAHELYHGLNRGIKANSPLDSLLARNFERNALIKLHEVVIRKGLSILDANSMFYRINEMHEVLQAEIRNFKNDLPANFQDMAFTPVDIILG
jgi:hypothetical protein